MNATTVLEYFKEITRVPRESGHEGPMMEYLQQFAAKHNLACKTVVHLQFTTRENTAIF